MGAIVELLERLGYGAESRCKVMSSRLGFPMQRLENCLCQPSSKWVLFSIQGRIRQRKERDWLRLSSAVPKIQWDSIPHCQNGHLAMGNLNLYFFYTLIEGRWS